MCAAKVSVSDTQLDELILKSDFPKLKLAELQKPDALSSEATVSEQPAAKVSKALQFAPIWTYLSIGALFLQLALFLLTVKLISDFYKESKANSPKAANIAPTIKATAQNPSREAAVPSVEPVVTRESKPASQAGKGSLPQVRTQFKGVVGDFNGGFLRTALGGLIQIEADEVSRKALQISVNSQIKSGTSGGSLKIQYRFNPGESRSAVIKFDLPNLMISEKQRIAFRVKLAEPEMTSPEIQWGLMDDKGKVRQTSKSVAYVFWKRYELPMNEASGSPVNATSLLLTINPDGLKNTSGVIYLDDLTIE